MNSAEEHQVKRIVPCSTIGAAVPIALG